MNTFDDILTGVNRLLQTDSGNDQLKTDISDWLHENRLEHLGTMPTCLPHDFSECLNGMNEASAGQMPLADLSEMSSNLPHDFYLHPHSAFFSGSSHSASFTSSADASVGSCHHVTIDSLGYVHQDGKDEVGKVDNFNMYNKYGDKAGHVSADGVIYDAHDHKVGWVDASGLVHTPSGAVIYDAHGNMINGAAYMLLVYLGGAD